MTNESDRRKPLQFGIGSMLALTAGCALVFGMWRWMGISPRASLLLLVIFSASILASVSLLLMIARSISFDDDDNDESESDA